MVEAGEFVSAELGREGKGVARKVGCGGGKAGIGLGFGWVRGECRYPIRGASRHEIYGF